MHRLAHARGPSIVTSITKLILSNTHIKPLKTNTHINQLRINTNDVINDLFHHLRRGFVRRFKSCLTS